jgi:hypothetical protein
VPAARAWCAAQNPPSPRRPRCRHPRHHHRPLHLPAHPRHMRAIPCSVVLESIWNRRCAVEARGRLASQCTPPTLGAPSEGPSLQPQSVLTSTVDLSSTTSSGAHGCCGGWAQPTHTSRGMLAAGVGPPMHYERQPPSHTHTRLAAGPSHHGYSIRPEGPPCSFSSVYPDPWPAQGRYCSLQRVTPSPTRSRGHSSP